jgi:aspartate/methionine/tyrosine aminotransferase
MSHNPIFAIADRARELRETGVDVITLAAGEADAPTSAHIVDAAMRAAADPANHHYGSATGLGSLRDAIARRLIASTALPWSADDVLVTLGAKHALALAFNAILSGPHDTVLIPSPGWPGHRAAAHATGGRPQQVLTTPDRGYVITAADLEAAWVPGTRAVVLANPANPTGTAVTGEHWTAIADWAARRDVWVISDDVYGELVYDREHVPAMRAAPELRERCVLVDSVSKAHAMTGWRVGWLAAPPTVVDSATRLLSATITHVPQIAQAAALEALTNSGDEQQAAKTAYRERRDRAHGALSALPGVDCPLPDGGMFLLPDTTELLAGNRHGIRTTTDLAAWLLDGAHVAVVPGEAFEAPGRLRLCFAVDDDRLDQALARLTAALRTLDMSSAAR